MSNPQLPPTPGQEHDPTLEPEELQEPGQGGFLAKKGMQLAEIVDVDVNQEFVSNRGNKGWRWEFTWALVEHDPSKSLQVKTWMDNSSTFGASCLHNMFINIGIPHTVPNPNDISKSTGQPRKSFFKATCTKNIDGTISIKKEAFVGRKALVTNRWNVKCPVCNWNIKEGTKITNTSCGKKNTSECYWEANEKVVANPDVDKVYNDIDTTSILPPPGDSINMRPVEEKPEPMPQTASQSEQSPIPTPSPEPKEQEWKGMYSREDNNNLIKILRENTSGHIPGSGTVLIDHQGFRYTIQDNVITKAEKHEEQEAPKVSATPPPQKEEPKTDMTTEEDDDLPF